MFITFAFESLAEEAVEKRSTMITKGRRHVIVHPESMRHVDLESLAQILCPKTRKEKQKKKVKKKESSVPVVAD